MTAAQIVPALVIPLVLWRVYSRVRRNIGQQPFRAGRLTFGAIFFSLLLGLVALGARRSPDSLLALAAGVVVAVPLGLLGLRLTRFELADGKKFYTPNTILGLAITMVFVGRVAYRLTVVLTTPPVAGTRAAMLQSPLTLFVFGLTAAYYVTYYAGVLLRARRLAAAPGAPAGAAEH